MEQTFNVYLRLPPLPRYARTARLALAAMAAYHRVDQYNVENLTMALGEALANAIVHSDTNDDIEVGFRIDDDTIVATVSDRGRGIADPDGKLNAPLPSESSEQGRGFAIMERCTDFFDVRSIPGGGTTVTLGQHRRNHQEGRRLQLNHQGA